MNKTIISIIAIFLIALTVPTWFSYLKDRSESNGPFPDTTYTKLDETKSNYRGYSITYNLNNGNLVKENPNYYNLFTPNFTLNNPVKSNYEFIGWTGSNGTEPQLKVTICTGSAGDLEFTANYVYSLGIPKVTRNEYIVSWNEVDEAYGYIVSINEIEVLETTETFFNLEENLNNLSDGTNLIKIKAFTEIAGKREYSKYSDALDFVYYNASAFENLVLTLNFTRSSSGYKIGTGLVELNYSFSGEYTGGYVDNNIREDDLTTEQHLLKRINPNRDYSELVFNEYGLFQLIEYIDIAYSVHGSTKPESMIIDVTNYLKFNIHDSVNTTYIPNKISFNVTFEEMFNEALFYEGCTVDLSKCATSNSFAVGFAGWAGADGSNFLTEIFLKDVDGKTWSLRYYDLFQKKNTYYKLGENEVSEDVLNAYMTNLKFYLNSEYYLKLSVDASTLIKDLYSSARTLRQEYENSIGNTSPSNIDLWSYASQTYAFNLADYFDVYSNDGTKVTFNYNLYCNFNTTRYL